MTLEKDTIEDVKVMISTGLSATQIGKNIDRSATYVRNKVDLQLGEEWKKRLFKNGKNRQKNKDSRLWNQEFTLH